MSKIGIIGGGVMGLTVAHRLSKLGHSVHVIESGNQMGGLSTWFDFGDFVWDKYYHVILQQDQSLIELLQELNIADRLVWKQTKTGFLWKGQLLSMSNHWEFLKFPVINLWEKARLAAGIYYAHYLGDPGKLEKVSAKDWLTSVFGKGVYEAIWEPLLASKFGVLKEKVPAVLIWATINRYFSTRKGSSGKEFMSYIQGGGLRIMLEALCSRIQERGGTLHCSEKVKSLESKPSGVVLRSDKQEYTFDRVINTLPTVLFQKIAPQLMTEVPGSDKFEFLGVIRLALVMNKPLTPYYVTNLIDKDLSFTGIIELSQVVDPSEFKQKHLVMIPRYDVPHSDWFEKSDEEISKIFLGKLKQVHPDIESRISRSFVHRERVVQAVWFEAPPFTKPWKSSDGKVWSINAELAGRDNLNNNAIIRTAENSLKEFLNEKA